MLAVAASDAPSAWITVVTALGGALVGGLIAAGSQLLVEDRRAAHESDLEADRAEQQARERAEQDAALTRGAARLLSEEINAAMVAMRLWADQKMLYDLASYLPVQTLPAEDERLIARHLTPEQWRRVAKARSDIRWLTGIAKARMGDASYVALTDSETDRAIIGGMRGVAVDAAKAVLELGKLTDDLNLAQDRIDPREATVKAREEGGGEGTTTEQA